MAAPAPVADRSIESRGVWVFRDGQSSPWTPGHPNAGTPEYWEEEHNATSHLTLQRPLVGRRARGAPGRRWRRQDAGPESDQGSVFPGPTVAARAGLDAVRGKVVEQRGERAARLSEW